MRTLFAGDGERIDVNTGTGVAISDTAKKKCETYSSLFLGTKNIESFLFFSDPHVFTDGLETDSQRSELLDPILLAYRHTPTSFCLCGGDWLQGDTKPNAAYKLGWIDGYMRKNFSNYVPVLGNHDTNYQGEDWGGTLAHETIRNLFFRENGNSYYKYQAVNTMLYVLDTFKPNLTELDAYYWEQIDWLAKALKADDKPHSFIAAHIAINYEKPEPVCVVYCSVANAYNKREKLELNGETYDFSECTGICHFVLAGHEHYDWDGVVEGIPVILTTQTKDGSDRAKWPTFDLCLADYDAKILHMTRIGNGVDRDIPIL